MHGAGMAGRCADPNIGAAESSLEEAIGASREKTRDFSLMPTELDPKSLRRKGYQQIRRS
jgi:hypothetical protein